MKYSPFSRGFRVWLYRDFVKTKVNGWLWAQAVARAVFPEESEADEETVRNWYRNDPGYPEKLEQLGSPAPAEYFEQWCASHPEEAKELKELMSLKRIEPGRQSFGIRAQQYLSERQRVAIPVYSLQPQPYIPRNDLRQVCGAMCQVLAVGFAAWCTAQYMKTAAS